MADVYDLSPYTMFFGPRSSIRFDGVPPEIRAMMLEQKINESRRRKALDDKRKKWAKSHPDKKKAKNRKRNKIAKASRKGR